MGGKPVLDFYAIDNSKRAKDWMFSDENHLGGIELDEFQELEPLWRHLRKSDVFADCMVDFALSQDQLLTAIVAIDGLRMESPVWAKVRAMFVSAAERELGVRALSD